MEASVKPNLIALDATHDYISLRNILHSQTEMGQLGEGVPPSQLPKANSFLIGMWLINRKVMIFRPYLDLLLSV